MPSGNVSGTFKANKISGGKLNIGANGGYLRVGEGYTHPEVSGLNITGSNGVDFNGNGVSDLGSINLQGGGTGQTFTLSNIGTNFEWHTSGLTGITGVKYVKYDLTFKYGICIGRTNQGTVKIN